jgi:parallel beta-helix repeat protein
MTKRFARSLAAATLCLAAHAASATVRYVDQYAPGPEHNGRTWQTAVTTIPQAITSAVSGDEVWVSYGTYTDPITLKAGVSVYGGFIGYEFFRDQRPGIQGLTTISGGGTSFNVMAGTGITPATVFDGFTISNGRGIQCLGGSPTISHNILTENYVPFDGAIDVSGGGPVIIDNILTANTGPGKTTPAGISYEGTPIIANNTIVGNAGCAISGSGNAVIYNNIVAYNLYGISARQSGSYPVVSHNCVYGNLILGYLQMAKPDFTGVDGNIAVDPKFAVYAYGNLHLAADSPCRDAGGDSVVGAGDTDIDHQPRILGTHVDIGADESDGRTWTFTPTIVRVSPTGNDANDGSTWALAKKTIQAGIDLASSQGGDVWVEGGTYTLASASSSTYSIVLKPYCYVYGGFAGTETALAQRDWAANPTFLVRQSGGLATATAGYRVSCLDGFICQPAASATPIPVSGIVCNGGSPYIRNNVFPRNQGTVISSQSASPIIAGNAFASNNPGSAYGIVVCDYAPALITGNVFSSNGPFGTNPSAGVLNLATTGPATITNNLFVNNYVSNSGTTYSSCIVGQHGNIPNLISNNTFVGNRGVAITVGSTSIVVNNVFAQNDGCLRQAQSAPGRVAQNCYYGSLYPAFDIGAGLAGNTRAYPQFASLLSGDYRLLAISPCVDAGDDSVVSAGDTDLDGNPRIQGRHVDMGCYESSATSTVAHWPDIARALKIAGGLLSATPNDASVLNTQKPVPGVDLLDAQQLIRKLTISSNQ